MTKKIINILILSLIFTCSIGLASWLIPSTPTLNTNSNNVTHNESNNEFVDVTVHYRTQSNEESEPITEYFIPKTYDISHNLTYLDKNGNKSYSEITSSDVTVSNKDSLLVYYDVNNGTYTKIDQRSQTKGPEQVKSFSANVSEWQSVSSAVEYGSVWDLTVDHPDKSNYRLRFEQDSGQDLLGSHGFKYNDGDEYRPEEKVLESVEEVGNKTITTQIYQRIIIDKQDKITFGKKMLFISYCKWVYYATIQQRMVRITQTKAHTTDHDETYTIKVKKNTFLNAIDLKINDYKNYGYYSDDTYENYFDFSKPITESKDIYLRYIKSSNNISSNIDNQSSETLNLYDGYLGVSGDIDVSRDSTYHNTTNSVFIDGFTVKQGKNVNLTYGEALTYIEPVSGTVPKDSIAAHRGTDNSIAPDYDGSTYIGDDNSSIHIKLNGDVTINGTLTIGGMIGGYSATSYYSFIIGKYAILDLHGHTITIDGGSIISYGLIKDSLGGGKIIVKNGGNITSVLTVSDGRGRDSSALGIAKRQSPFTEYKFSYLQVPVEFNYGTTLNGYLKMDFADMGIMSLNVPIIGKEFNKYLFSWGTKTESNKDYILYEPYQIEALSTPSNTTIYKNMYNWRNRFTFNANVREAAELVLSATVDTAMGSVDINIDFARIDVPISPFFDIILNSGYSMEINSKMILYPGSSFYVSKNSTLNFKSIGQKTYSEIAAGMGTRGITIPGETRYIAGGLMSYTNNIKDLAVNSYSNFNVGVYNETTYWNYVKESNIVIDGDITFDNNIDTSKSDGYYYLSGNITLCDSALNSIVDNRNYLKTYDFKSEIRQAFLYDANNYSIDKQYTLATSYNINPLISSTTAYFIDKNNLVVGRYDKSIGILFDEVNNKKYFLKTDNDMYEDGSAGSNQSSRIDRNIVLQEVNQVNSTYKIIKDTNENNYIYYCGLYVPVVSGLSDNLDDLTYANNAELIINARKFMSNSNATINKPIDGSSVNIASKFSQMIVRYNSSTKQWKYYNFSV